MEDLFFFTPKTWFYLCIPKKNSHFSKDFWFKKVVQKKWPVAPTNERPTKFTQTHRCIVSFPVLRFHPGSRSSVVSQSTAAIGRAPLMERNVWRLRRLKEVKFWGVLGGYPIPGDSSRDLFGMVKTWPFQGVVGDLQRSGIKKSQLESPGSGCIVGFCLTLRV